MIVIAGHIDLDPAKRDEAIAAANVMMEKTRQEDGCVTYVMSADFSDPGKFRIFEEWESDAALGAHFTAPHMAEFQAKMANFGVRGMTIEKYVVESKSRLS